MTSLLSAWPPIRAPQRVTIVRPYERWCGFWQLHRPFATRARCREGAKMPRVKPTGPLITNTLSQSMAH